MQNNFFPGGHGFPNKPFHHGGPFGMGGCGKFWGGKSHEERKEHRRQMMRAMIKEEIQAQLPEIAMQVSGILKGGEIPSNYKPYIPEEPV